MTLEEARAAIAAKANTVPGVKVRVSPVRTPVTGDGWVSVERVAPSSFDAFHATLNVTVVLGSDAEPAEKRLNEWCLPVAKAVLNGFPCADASAQGAIMLVGQANLHVLILTLTMEVS